MNLSLGAVSFRYTLLTALVIFAVGCTSKMAAMGQAPSQALSSVTSPKPTPSPSASASSLASNTSSSTTSPTPSPLASSSPQRGATQSCPIANGYATQTWNGTSWGSCQLVTCNMNYIPQNNSCLPAVQTCPIANGYATQTWNGNSWGACQLVSCNTNYVPQNNACQSIITTCGADVVNNSSVDATTSLQNCFSNATSSIIELVPGQYFINSTINFSNRKNITLRTQGLTSGAACLSPGGPNCAVLIASANNPGPEIFNSTGNSNVTFSYFAIDGNINQRRAQFSGSNSNWIQGIAYNAIIQSCTSCTFNGFASVRAAQGTGLEFDGDNAIFNNVLFRDNGWGIMNLPNQSDWSDGLTILSSNNLQITNSTFMDNSDIDLIIGNAQNATITNNTIGNTYNFAYGGMMLDNFNNSMQGNFSGTNIYNNQINCGNGMCGIGIMVGPHMWYNSNPVIGGSIYNNSVIGARQGILTDGANGAQIYNNTVGVFGLYSKGSYTTNAISATQGDVVNIYNNNFAPTTNQIAGASVQILWTLLSTMYGTNFQISQIFRDVLGRDPDASGGPYWTAQLDSNAFTVSQIRTQIAQSTEAQNDINNIYQAILGRPVDSGGAASWTQYLINGGSLAEMWVLLQSSQEGVGFIEL